MTLVGTRPPGPPKGPRGPEAGRPPIDPRIRQRRIAVTRQSGRRRLRVLVGLLAITAAVVGADLVLHSSLLSVSRVEVSGAHATTVAAIDAAAAPVLHHPMMSVDSALVERRVAALPWVDTVTVARHWPSTLVVTVTERSPVAQLAEGQQWALLDASGRVLTVGPTQTPGYVDLEAPVPPGPAGSVVPAADLPAVQVAAALRTSDTMTGGPVLDAVIVTPDGQVSLAIEGGIEVDLGPTTALTDKITALGTVLSGVDLAGARTVDLRVPERPVLTRG